MKGMYYVFYSKFYGNMVGHLLTLNILSRSQVSLLMSWNSYIKLVVNYCFILVHFCRYSMDDTGAVSSIAWTPDSSAFAVGWKLRGLTVWSISGCRLMSTIRQIGSHSASSPGVKQNPDGNYEPLMSGTSLMQWDEYGYRLYAVEVGSSERILAFSFGKCCLNRGVSGKTHVRQVIYGEDRLLVVQPEDTDELKLMHLNLPVTCSINYEVVLFLYSCTLPHW